MPRSQEVSATRLHAWQAAACSERSLLGSCSEQSGSDEQIFDRFSACRSNRPRFHAKVAVADGDVCFITSANLTGYAMEQNMEAGVLISGGAVPHTLADHLISLLQAKIIQPV